MGSRIPLLLESKKEVPLIVEMTVVVSVDVIAVVVIASVVVAAAVVAAAVVDPESVICDSNMFVSLEEASSSVVEILTGRVVSLEELSTSVELAVAIVALFRELLLLPSVGPCDEVGAPVGAINELLVELKPPSSSLKSGKATAADGLAVGIIICARRRGRAAMDAIGSRLFDCLILSLFCYRFMMLDVFNTCKSR